MSADGFHHCQNADEFLRDGLLAILYDPRYPGWFLVHSRFDDWERWEDDRSQPFPFQSDDQDYYGDGSVGIAFCPWCGISLSTILSPERTTT